MKKFENLGNTRIFSILRSEVKLSLQLEPESAVRGVFKDLRGIIDLEKNQSYHGQSWPW